MESNLDKRREKSNRSEDPHTILSREKQQRESELKELKHYIQEKLSSIDRKLMTNPGELKLTESNIDKIKDRVKAEINFLISEKGEESEMVRKLKDIESKLERMNKIYPFLKIIEKQRVISIDQDDRNKQLDLPFKN